MNAIPVPPLTSGDRLTQPEFHRRYQMYPDHVKFELIGGIVYMASPLRWPHGSYHPALTTIFGLYASQTVGVSVGDNATTILGPESEPQPDLVMRIGEEFGGQSKINEDAYLEGPPELIAEVAHSTVAYDMHLKREDYRKSGVLEYLVLCIEEQEIHWFHFPSGGKILPNKKGVYKSKVFPGLWVDGPALLRQDLAAALETVANGTASREHGAFVKRLAKAKNSQAND